MAGRLNALDALSLSVICLGGVLVALGIFSLMSGPEMLSSSRPRREPEMRAAEDGEEKSAVQRWEEKKRRGREPGGLASGAWSSILGGVITIGVGVLIHFQLRPLLDSMFGDIFDALDEVSNSKK